jgi:hypothetical protein
MFMDFRVGNIETLKIFLFNKNKYMATKLKYLKKKNIDYFLTLNKVIFKNNLKNS